MNCPAYPRENAAFTDTTSEAAAEGTFAHSISEMCLRDGKNADDFIGVTSELNGFTFTWTDDDAQFLQPGLDRIRSFGDSVMTEMRVDLQKWLGVGQFGTLDRAAIVSDDYFVICDLKWGRGVAVDAVGNKQLRLYALGFLEYLRVKGISVPKSGKILIIVDQPRNAQGGGEWEITVSDLLEFGKEATEAALRAEEPDAPRIPSLSACRWCKLCASRPGCPEFDDFMLDVVTLKMTDLDDLFDDVSLPEPHTLTPERRAFIIRHRSMFEKWLDTLHGGAMYDAVAGLPSGGLKAVHGRRNPAKWANRKDAEGTIRLLVGDAGFRPDLRTPKQILSLVDEETLRLFGVDILHPEPSLALVPETDARPAYILADALMEEDTDD